MRRPPKKTSVRRAALRLAERLTPHERRALLLVLGLFLLGAAVRLLRRAGPAR